MMDPNAPLLEEEEDDEDFVPQEKDSDDDGPEEEGDAEDGGGDDGGRKSSKGKRKKSVEEKSIINPRLAKRGKAAGTASLKENSVSEFVTVISTEELKKQKEEEEKRKAEELFRQMQEESKQPLASSSVENTKSSTTSSTTVTKTYDFAGETITVQQKVTPGSTSISSASSVVVSTSTPSSAISKPSAPPAQSAKPPPPGIPKAKPKGDLSSILGVLKPKQSKMSVLDKSRLDWDQYKDKEGLKDELQHSTKGGYLEKMAFLQRADVRQFEIERDIRLKAQSRKPPARNDN